jgi:MFS family permease
VSLASAFSTLKKYPVAGYAFDHHRPISHGHGFGHEHDPGSCHKPRRISDGGGICYLLHILGMYAFAPLFGILSDKIGPVKTILTGQLIFVAALLIAGLGSEQQHLVTIGLFFWALAGQPQPFRDRHWLAVSVPVDQKTNVQGLSDSLMNLSGAFGGAISGTLVALFLFTGLNLIALLPVAVIVTLRCWLQTTAQLAKDSKYRRPSGPRINLKRETRSRDFVIESEFCDPSGIRTRAAAVRGQCPRPLNDGAV